MARTCARCGTTATPPETGDAAGGLPDGWSMATSDRGVEFHCDVCTRTNIRAIEAKLPEEWWEG